MLYHFPCLIYHLLAFKMSSFDYIKVSSFIYIAFFLSVSFSLVFTALLAICEVARKPPRLVSDPRR